MNIKKITEGPMMANCYVVYDENKRRAKLKEMECEKNEFI